MANDSDKTDKGSERRVDPDADGQIGPAGTEFYVGHRPQVTWAWDLSERGLDFVRGIDARYYEHVAKSQGALLDSDDRQYAAAALRVAYGQGLETLVAFIAAALQAPQCVVGWMLAYRNGDLSNVAADVTHIPPVIEYLAPPVDRDPLALLASETLAQTGWSANKQKRLAEAFAEAWGRWCREYLDKVEAAEYNSLKHGTRARLGGFSLMIGMEHIPGESAPAESMRTVGASEFGSTFFVAEHLNGVHHQYPRRTSKNWNPVALAHGLQLIAMSIQNIVSFLRIVNSDDPSECPFAAPSNMESFGLPWQSTGGIKFMNLDRTVASDDIIRWTKEEVIRHLRQRRPSD